MGGIKKLAGETMWYGLSTIIARFINYLLTPYLVIQFTTIEYGTMSLFYLYIPFFNILFTYGLETSYFRFSQSNKIRQEVYNTTSVSIFISTVIFSCLLFVFSGSLESASGFKGHVEYIIWAVCIIAFDALSTLPFAKLRQENRPLRFAFIRISGILLNIAVIVFFLSLCPKLALTNPDSYLLKFYNPKIREGYIFIANIAQSAFTLFLLRKELFSFQWKFNLGLWKEIMLYSMPLIWVGIGGMINETLGRIMLENLYKGGPDQARIQVGIFSAELKLAILISLFIQAFRLGAEPFFFKQSDQPNAPKTYARVMKFFVIAVCCMFLFVALYIDVWKYFIPKKEYWDGLYLMPLLLMSYMFLGIYYNLSVWYKLTNKTNYAAYITFLGAGITIAVNYFFVPQWGYVACAWGSFFCYGTMMVVSYIQGQKHYRIPYAWKKLLAYITIVLLLYFLHQWMITIYVNRWFNLLSASILMIGYIVFVALIEKKEWQSLKAMLGRAGR